ncbi:haloacid dehalogenase-like hydrolase [Fervidibacillus halotolerans]|uniref:Haloacid dehalogenase-like hydrolase n=1 Tax=Fervidibacillus halotolerans TaxID=2980027 RepID=A0A9E8M0G5_9BACI|nr:haloacid dehalogenase-like hydrolase [Fervidibacillus halotolerans]WAA12054.1 haloacid dehalogenase-like hydrolase [Fervidibacillus halotolerans]
MKRLLNCTASDFQKMTGQDLKRAIDASEGRTMVSEVICTASPLYPGLTNAEYAAAFGADLILLNFFDVNHPKIEGLEGVSPNQLLRKVKELVGRPVGVNLEPVDLDARGAETLSTLSEGRMATLESLKKAKELGADFVCLTGNPKTGVTNKEITKSIQLAREAFGKDGLIIAGKMHGAGVKGEAGINIVSEEVVRQFVEAGADVILLPGVGTVPGTSLDKLSKLVETAKSAGALVMTTIGTSQEGADEETIKRIALYNKMAGADIHHIGDTGLMGIAVPENIMVYSIAIRGRRHTFTRMAASILR